MDKIAGEVIREAMLNAVASVVPVDLRRIRRAPHVPNGWRQTQTEADKLIHLAMAEAKRARRAAKRAAFMPA